MRPVPHSLQTRLTSKFGGRWPLGFIGIGWLALGLRVSGLNTRPLWYDEAFAVLFSEKGFWGMLAGTLTQVQGVAADVHPIAYYTVLDFWMRIFGQSPFAVRLLSVFAGLLTVVIIFELGRLLFSQRAAIVAMLMVAVMPFHIYYSQETRMYAPLALFCLMSILFFVRAVQAEMKNSRQIWQHWLGFVLSSAAALYMQNLAVVFLLTLGLSTLPRPRIYAKMAIAGVIVLTLWLPWFVNLGSQFAKLQQAYWVTKPTLLTLLQTLLVYHTGEELLEVRLLLPVALFVAIVLPLMLIFQIVMARLKPKTNLVVWLVGLAFGTPFLLFVISLFQPVYVQRALLPAALLYVIGVSWLLVEATMPNLIRLMLASLLTVTLLGGLYAHYTFAQFPRPNFQSAIAFLENNVQSGDLVLHSNKLTFFPMHYYDRNLSQSFLADPPGSGSDTLALPTQKVLGLYADHEIEMVVLPTTTRVWFVIFARAIEEYSPESHPHLNWLLENFQVAAQNTFNDLTVYQFVR